MCENVCDSLETFNPEIEYQKFLKRKPIVQTFQLYENLQAREKVKCPYNFKGYGVEKDVNAMYRTYNSEYGYYAPNAFTISSRHFPLSQKFSNELHRCGMYRNFSLNTHANTSEFGHTELKSHLARVGVLHDKTCRACQEDDETLEHYLCHCPVFSQIRKYTRYEISKRLKVEKPKKE